MKKLLISLALAASVAASGLMYPATMICTDVSGDLVTMQAASGDVFQMRGDGWNKGEVVSLLMWSEGTPDDVTDDIILSARHSGFIAG